MAFALQPEYGLVVAVAVGSVFLHHGVMAAGVISARKKYGIKYPTMYADATNCANKEDVDKFNCVQRGHQNSLENHPAFLTLLLLAGVRHPITAAAAGAIYLVGRYFYFKGYSTGDPSKRMQGRVLYVGLLTLLGTAIKFSVDLLTSSRTASS